MNQEIIQTIILKRTLVYVIVVFSYFYSFFQETQRLSEKKDVHTAQLLQMSIGTSKEICLRHKVASFSVNIICISLENSGFRLKYNNI